MRTLIGAIAVLMVTGFAASQEKKDEKIDAKQLVGKWENADETGKQVYTYTADGKFTMVYSFAKVKAPDIKQEGTYKVEGNKLTQTYQQKFGKDVKHVVNKYTIHKLTDEELVTEPQEMVTG